MPSPNYYNVKVSREAGVFLANIKVHAEGKTDAKRKAFRIADENRMNKDFWTYDEAIFLVDEPLVQVEDVQVE